MADVYSALMRIKSAAELLDDYERPTFAGGSGCLQPERRSRKRYLLQPSVYRVAW